MSCLAVGVAPVTFGLPGCIVFDHPSDARFLGCFSPLDFGNCRGFGCRLPLGYLFPRALLFLKLQAIALDTSLFAGGSDSHTFGLPRELGRTCRILRRPVGIEESRLGGGGCGLAISDVGISRFLHSDPVVYLAIRLALLRASGFWIGCERHAVAYLFGEARLS